MANPYDQLFGRRTVKTLTSRDFHLDRDPPVQLKYNDCMLVLFHGNNSESLNMANIFAYAAANVVGPVFAHVELERDKEVAEAFMRLHNSPGAFNRFTLEGYPTIIAYQNTMPVGFYNGDRDAQAIVDYAYTLACRPGYFEPEQLSKSVHIDQSIEMGGYVQSPTYNSSTQFTAGTPLNRYDPNTGVVVTGSQAATSSGQEQGTPQGAPQGAPQGVPQGVPQASPQGALQGATAAAPVPSGSSLGTPVAIG